MPPLDPIPRIGDCKGSFDWLTKRLQKNIWSRIKGGKRRLQGIETASLRRDAVKTAGQINPGVFAHNPLTMCTMDLGNTILEGWVNVTVLSSATIGKTCSSERSTRRTRTAIFTGSRSWSGFDAISMAAKPEDRIRIHCDQLPLIKQSDLDGGNGWECRRKRRSARSHLGPSSQPHARPWRESQPFTSVSMRAVSWRRPQTGSQPHSRSFPRPHSPPPSSRSRRRPEPFTRLSM